MINQIVDGICTTLNKMFGDTYTIYTESVEQALKTPCFFVSCINPAKSQFLGQRYYNANQFCIQFISDSDEPKTDCNDIAYRLFEYLEYIQINDNLIRGTKMHAEIVNGVLNFFVNYNMFTYRTEDDSEPMNDIDINSDVKG